jgi:predicted component of type VI protein secretion system
MNTPIQINVEGEMIPFQLDQDNWQWHSSQQPEEAAFPLMATVDRKRLELYSDGTYAEVEK